MIALAMVDDHYLAKRSKTVGKHNLAIPRRNYQCIYARGVDNTIAFATKFCGVTEKLHKFTENRLGEDAAGVGNGGDSGRGEGGKLVAWGRRLGRWGRCRPGRGLGRRRQGCLLLVLGGGGAGQAFRSRLALGGHGAFGGSRAFGGRRTLSGFTRRDGAALGRFALQLVEQLGKTFSLPSQGIEAGDGVVALVTGGVEDAGFLSAQGGELLLLDNEGFLGPVEIVAAAGNLLAQVGEGGQLLAQFGRLTFDAGHCRAQ